MFTEKKLKVILILLDDEGHAEWDLAKHLGIRDSNLNPILKELEKRGIIFQGQARKSGKEKSRNGDYKEFPYYLARKLDILKTLIKEIAESTRFYETSFILFILKESKYICAMKEGFGDEVNKTIAEELGNSYPPFSDTFIKNVINPPLEKVYACRSSPKGLELWYYKYLNSLPNNPRWSWPL